LRKTLSARLHWGWRLLIAFSVLMAALAIATIRTELPPDLRGTLVVQGRISHCEFQPIRGGFFMGVRLDTAGAPYLRLNGARSQRSRYEALCARSPVVRVFYRAQQQLVGPMSFWICDLAEVSR